MKNNYNSLDEEGIAALRAAHNAVAQAHAIGMDIDEYDKDDPIAVSKNVNIANLPNNTPSHMQRPISTKGNISQLSGKIANLPNATQPATGIIPKNNIGDTHVNPNKEPTIIETTQHIDIKSTETALNTDGTSMIELSDLPSKKLFYKNNIYGQPFKLLDLITLGDIDYSNSTSRFTEILNRRIKGINAEDILNIDEAYILHWLRASSFPNDGFPIGGFTCSNSKCKFKVNDPMYSVNFSNLDFIPQTPPNEIFELIKNTGYYKFYINNREIHVFPRKRLHDRIIDEYIVKKYTDLKPDTIILTLLGLAVVIEVDGCEDLDDKIHYLSELSITETETFYNELNKCTLSSKTVVSHHCPKCGEVTTEPFPFRLTQYISTVRK